MIKNDSYYFATIPIEKVLDDFNVKSEIGLSKSQVERNKLNYGTNILKESNKVTTLEILIRQFKSLVIVLLLLALGFSIYLGNNLEALAIFIVIILNTVIAFFTELKATRSMEALSKIGVSYDVVLREGGLVKISSDEIVLGDIISLEAGDIVSADIRIIKANNLYVNESAFTGESLPVKKNHLFRVSRNDLNLMQNMLFRGTFITTGSAKGIVVNVGMRTEIGKIADLTYSTKDELTPLEKKLNVLGRKLIEVAFVMSFLVAISGIISGREISLMIEVAVALTIAAIPEGLPIVATLALARGMIIMSRKNALINKLSAVETLGTTTTIFTDKTGTLTENIMKVTSFICDEFKVGVNDLALKVAALCNSASISKDKIGDTMEIALLEWASENGFEKEILLQNYPIVREYPFDFHRRMMATVHHNERYFYAVKGAPEEVIDNCSYIQLNNKIEMFNNKQEWKTFNDKISYQGARVLSIAYKFTKSLDESPFDNLIFLGLVELKDPAVKGIEKSIDQCHLAGIKVIMLTGDHKGTAKSIAQRIHIAKEFQDVISGSEYETFKEHDELYKINDCVVFARVNPKQKLELIDYYQKRQEIVAMTGDGVNDAPALKKADIGIAMGIRGTQVAKEASDVILKDDQFSSIVSAIFQGRVIFNNIRYFIIYLISCNMSEVLSVGIASISNLPLPIKPLHILFLNLVTDVFPALALGMSRGSESFMQTPPRDSKENILTKKIWLKIISFGLIITISVLGILIYGINYLKLGPTTVVTMSFFTMAFSQLFHVFNVRSFHSKMFDNDIVKNVYIWMAIILCFILMFLTMAIPSLKEVMKLESLNLQQWIVVFLFSILPVIVIQIYIVLYKKFRP